MVVIINTTFLCRNQRKVSMALPHIAYRIARIVYCTERYALCDTLFDRLTHESLRRFEPPPRFVGVYIRQLHDDRRLHVPMHD